MPVVLASGANPEYHPRRIGGKDLSCLPQGKGKSARKGLCEGNARTKLEPENLYFSGSLYVLKLKMLQSLLPE